MDEKVECPHMFCAVIEEGTIPVREIRHQRQWEQQVHVPITVRVDWLQCQVCGMKRSIEKDELLLSDLFIAVMTDG